MYICIQRYTLKLAWGACRVLRYKVQTLRGAGVQLFGLEDVIQTTAI